MHHLEWEQITVDETTWRLPVAGGWLVLYRCKETAHQGPPVAFCAMSFVPDPKHGWTTKTEVWKE